MVSICLRLANKTMFFRKTSSVSDHKSRIVTGIHISVGLQYKPIIDDHPWRALKDSDKGGGSTPVGSQLEPITDELSVTGFKRTRWTGRNIFVRPHFEPITNEFTSLSGRILSPSQMTHPWRDREPIRKGLDLGADRDMYHPCRRIARY